MRKLLTLTAAAAFIVAFSFAGTAWAVDVTISNPSFEDDGLAVGQFTTVAPAAPGPGGVGLGSGLN